MTDIDSVRLLIPDLDTSNQALSDEQITSLLNLSDGKVFLAAARALEIIATDEALVYKIVTTDDLSVNGVTGATQVLLARAKTLRADQAQADSDAHPEDGFALVFPVESEYPLWPEATPYPTWPRL